MEIIKTILEGNGDFRSEECLKLLEEADIVITNPPFSLFREFFDLLIEYKKKFLIIGNIASIGCKNVFPYFARNEVWLGPSIRGGDRWFKVPKNYPLAACTCKSDETGRYVKVKGVRWFTNLKHNYQQPFLDLKCSYEQNPEDYPFFDHFPAINVNRTKDIPFDYDGLMGVPLTFIDKYNPKQFEIIEGLQRYPVIKSIVNNPKGTFCSSVNGKEMFFRIIIRRK